MKHPFDVLTLVLIAVAFGLAFLPILAFVSPNNGAITPMAGAYGAIVVAVAPLIARRRGNGKNGGGDAGE